MIGMVVTLSIFILTNITLIAVAWGRLTQRMDEFEERTGERLDRIEKAVGITNGEKGGAFVPRRECLLMETAVKETLHSLHERFLVMESDIKRLTERGLGG